MYVQKTATLTNEQRWCTGWPGRIKHDPFVEDHRHQVPKQTSQKQQFRDKLHKDVNVVSEVSVGSQMNMGLAANCWHIKNQQTWLKHYNMADKSPISLCLVLYKVHQECVLEMC